MKIGTILIVMHSALTKLLLILVYGLVMPAHGLIRLSLVTHLSALLGVQIRAVLLLIKIGLGVKLAISLTVCLLWNLLTSAIRSLLELEELSKHFKLLLLW